MEKGKWYKDGRNKENSGFKVILNDQLKDRTVGQYINLAKYENDRVLSIFYNFRTEATDFNFSEARRIGREMFDTEKQLIIADIKGSTSPRRHDNVVAFQYYGTCRIPEVEKIDEFLEEIKKNCIFKKEKICSNFFQR